MSHRVGQAGLRICLCALTLLAWIVPALAQSEGAAQEQTPDVPYRVIDEPVATSDAAIPVIEFFLYGCPHCHAFDDALTRWAEQLPDDVEFKRVPVLFGPHSRFYARLFYTEKSLGVFDRLHAEVLSAIHEHGRPLDSMRTARAFFEAHGVDGERFRKAFNDPAIDRKVAQAARLMRRFQVTAVPSLGVAGRYWLTGQMAGSNKAMLAVADKLIERTRVERTSHELSAPPVDRPSDDAAGD